MEGCQALDPAKEWATKVKLKWPNDIYGEFPAEETWRRVELKKLGGILVNASFGGNVADVIIGMSLSDGFLLVFRNGSRMRVKCFERTSDRFACSARGFDAWTRGVFKPHC